MMRLEKYHGLGNDFLILLDLAGDHPVDEQVARALCDRHTGAGADGLIRLSRDGVATTRMELYNADGSRAETSGNGLRCAARALVDAGVERGPELTIVTDAGAKRLVVGPDDVSVDMGPARVELLDDERARVDMGNPHVVVLTHDLHAFVDHDPDVNVEAIVVGPEPDSLTMRVWERGAGETLACGTGSCAAAAAAHEWGLVGNHVVVRNPGGSLVVDLKPDDIVLTGPAVHVATVEVHAT